MNPIHVVANKDDISELVLIPGDPLRAKYIAENFLEDAHLINDVRNMLGYTGTYKGIKLTVIGSGMGIPSMGIYAYELAKFYGVKRIIRIGSAGALDPSVHIRDLVVATKAYSLSNFAYAFSGEEKNVESGTESLINLIESTSSNENIHFGPILTSETFDVWTGVDHVLNRLSNPNVLASEMEAYALYHIGNKLGIETACIITIVDSKFEPTATLTTVEREKSLNEMIKLALEVLIK